MKKNAIIAVVAMTFVLIVSSCESSLGGNKVEIVNNDFVETSAGLNIRMVYVEGGEFLMGSISQQETNNDEQVHKVVLDSYYIGDCEITQEQWETVMGTSIQEQAQKEVSALKWWNIFHLKDADDDWELYPDIVAGPDYPMYYVNWKEVVKFCKKLSKMTGKNYCLPTEAQWEYAARGGKNHDGTDYSGSSLLDEVAWKNGDSIHPVKTKRANSLGLYDMSGNVAEWCSDRYGVYDANDVKNPAGPSSGSCRVCRGGTAWNSPLDACRVSSRLSYEPDLRYSIGFRVVVLP